MTSSLDTFAGLVRREPWLAILMTLFLLSLTGIPPTAGFFAKAYVILAARPGERGRLDGARRPRGHHGAQRGGAAFYYLRVVVYMFMREPQHGAAALAHGRLLWGGLVVASVADRRAGPRSRAVPRHRRPGRARRSAASTRAVRTRRPGAPGSDARVPAVDSVGGRFELRLIPALLTAIGVVAARRGPDVVHDGRPAAARRAARCATYEPLPTVDGADHAARRERRADVRADVPGRTVSRPGSSSGRLDIDLPIMLQIGLQPGSTRCATSRCTCRAWASPGQGRATYIYAHARDGHVPAAAARVAAQQRRADARA